jgi:hypothetical protein
MVCILLCVMRKILLHAHTLLGKVLVNEFPRRQIFDKQSVAMLRNKRGGCVFYVVRAKQQYNGVMQSVSKQQNCKRFHNNRCFLWCPCRWLIREVNSDAFDFDFVNSDMVASTKGLGSEKGCGGKSQQHIQKTDPSSSQRRRPTKTRP